VWSVADVGEGKDSVLPFSTSNKDFNISFPCYLELRALLASSNRFVAGFKFSEEGDIVC
jgi:hypothetical protein